MIGMMASTRQPIIAPMSTEPYPPLRYWIAIDMVLNRRMSRVRYGSRKSFQIHIACRIATEITEGRMIGNTIWKKMRGTLAPSIIADSSNSWGMPLTTPVKMNTAKPAPKPRYTIHKPHGVFNPSMSAIFESVNITIWNGTIMLNRNSRYNAFAQRLFTRTIHHAHIDVHNRINPTAPTVTTTVQPNDSTRFVRLTPRV